MSLDTTPWHLDSRYQPTILSPNPTLLKPSRHVPTVTPLTACRPVPTRDLSHQPQYPSQYQNTIRPSPYPDPANRPSAPGRVHSFCGDSSTSTYALASASASAHLTPDKRSLVAPPLERTISSIGSRGNHSPPGQQMVRPKVVKQDVERPPSPPQSPVPVIVVQSITPPRPVLSTLRTPSSTSSRSSWYSVPFPITPISGLIFGSVVAEEGCEKQNDREAGVEDVVEGVGKLTVV